MRRLPLSGGLDNTWVQGRRASRFFINDNLAWSIGAHELRFGTNTRIFRLNDYDFGEGVVPLGELHDAAAIHLWSCVHCVENFPAGEFTAVQFPEPGPLCPGHVENHPDADLDLRNARHPQLEPRQSARRGRAPVRLVRRHHARRQPASQSSRSSTHLGNIFASTPLAILQPRTAIAWQLTPKTVLRTGFGLFSDILPGKRGRSGGHESAVLEDLSRWPPGHGGRSGHRTGSSE